MATKTQVKRILKEAGHAEWSWPRGGDDAIDGFSLAVRKGVVAVIHTGNRDWHEKILAKYASRLRGGGLAVTRKGTGLLVR